MRFFFLNFYLSKRGFCSMFRLKYNVYYSYLHNFQSSPHISPVHLFMQTPSSITTSGPIVTFGPIRQLLPILALGSLK